MGEATGEETAKCKSTVPTGRLAEPEHGNAVDGDAAPVLAGREGAIRIGVAVEAGGGGARGGRQRRRGGAGRRRRSPGGGRGAPGLVWPGGGGGAGPGGPGRYGYDDPD